MADVKQSQPQATPQMSVLGNRNAKNCPVGPDGKRDWSFGLFDCSDRCGLFCWSAWCPCIVYGKSRQRLRHLESQGTPLVADGGDSIDAHCCIYAVLGAYSGILQVGSRKGVRDHYGISGNLLSDCFAACICRPCALTQERREIELEEGSF